MLPSALDFAKTLMMLKLPTWHVGKFRQDPDSVNGRVGAKFTTTPAHPSASRSHSGGRTHAAETPGAVTFGESQARTDPFLASLLGVCVVIAMVMAMGAFVVGAVTIRPAALLACIIISDLVLARAGSAVVVVVCAPGRHALVEKPETTTDGVVKKAAKKSRQKRHPS